MGNKSAIQTLVTECIGALREMQPKFSMISSQQREHFANCGVAPTARTLTQKNHPSEGWLTMGIRTHI